MIQLTLTKNLFFFLSYLINVQVFHDIHEPRNKIVKCKRFRMKCGGAFGYSKDKSLGQMKLSGRNSLLPFAIPI